MTRALTIAAIAATSIGALAIAGCGSDDSDSTTAAAEATASEAPEQTAPAPAPEPGTTVKVSDSQFGPILFDAEDQAIYLFDKEGGPASECYGECADAWPPVLTDGEPQAGDGAKANLLGTTERDDGSTQVTYNGHPLYYYVDDPKGEVLCHDVDEFGGLWLVVDAAGNAV